MWHSCAGCAWRAAEFDVMHADGIERLVLPVLAAVHARAWNAPATRVAACTGCTWSTTEFDVVHADGIERLVLPVSAVTQAPALGAPAAAKRVAVA